jgi:hypothetical protein
VKVIVVPALAILALAGCSTAHPPHHHPRPVAATSSAADLSCQTAGNANIRAEGALGAGITPGTLSKASTFWQLAAHKISDSGVNLLHTKDGRLTVDLDYAALAASQAVLDIRMDPGHLSKTMDKLFAAEQKITSDCQ